MRKLIVALAAAVTVALGAWFALGATASTPHRAPTRSVAQVRPAAATVAGASLSGVTAQLAGTRAATSSESGGSGEQEGEGTSQEPPGEPTPGHEDPDGQNVDHQCPPSCDTANGEQP